VGVQVSLRAPSMILYPCPYCDEIHRISDTALDAYLCRFFTCPTTRQDFVIKGKRKTDCGVCDDRVKCVSIPSFQASNLWPS
jgi:hypothetical protein